MILDRRHVTSALAFLVLFFAACSESPSDSSDGSSGVRRIAMIPKGTTHQYWNQVKRGADAASVELGVELIWKGPLKEDDRVGQIELVQQFVAQGVDGLCIAPLDTRALSVPVKNAVRRGLPVVVFDSGLDGEPGQDFTSFIATDNTSAGKLGGEHLAGLVDAGGGVVLLRYLVGSASTTKREDGFLAAMSEAGCNVSVDNRYAGASSASAKTEALNMIDRLREADGVFCSNESATYGMLLALRQEGLAGRIKFVGFDTSPALVEALREGEIHALVVQDPVKMGELSIRTMIASLEGESVDAVIDTGCVVVTKANMDDPAIAPLLE
ncbi:MAG: substrate-binding domain-containing protein [Planctomycetota bacterium]